MILWIIACIACFVLGDLKGQGKLNWVRGAAGKARDVAFGLRPAAAAGHIEPAKADNGSHMAQSEVSPTPPKNPIRAGQAAKNILAFLGGLLAWMAKNPVLAIGLVLLAAFLLLGPPSCSPFGKSRGELRLEREIAEARAEVHQLEARMGELSRDLAVNTERDRTRRSQVITQAQQEIEHAAAQVDPEALGAAYERRYLCVLDASTCPGSADPAPSGPPAVRGAGAGPV